MYVSGIGGFFFRAADPDKLRAWYAEHLGVGTGENGEWATAAGPSISAPFPRASDYFPADRQWMLNLRVDGLDAMLAALAMAGIEVTPIPTGTCPVSAALPASTIPKAIRSSSGSPILQTAPDRRNRGRRS